MVNMNGIISANILNMMRQKDKKQKELSEYLGISKQVVSKMLNGSRIIGAAELSKIAEFLGVSMERLVEVPTVLPKENAIHVFMGKVESKRAIEGLEIADEIANLICFYARTRENEEDMMEEWEA